MSTPKGWAQVLLRLSHSLFPSFLNSDGQVTSQMDQHGQEHIWLHLCLYSLCKCSHPFEDNTFKGLFLSIVSLLCISLNQGAGAGERKMRKGKKRNKGKEDPSLGEEGPSLWSCWIGHGGTGVNRLSLVRKILAFDLVKNGPIEWKIKITLRFGQNLGKNGGFVESIEIREINWCGSLRSVFLLI